MPFRLGMTVITSRFWRKWRILSRLEKNDEPMKKNNRAISSRTHGELRNEGGFVFIGQKAILPIGRGWGSFDQRGHTQNYVNKQGGGGGLLNVFATTKVYEVKLST